MSAECQMRQTPKKAKQGKGFRVSVRWSTTTDSFQLNRHKRGAFVYFAHLIMTQTNTTHLSPVMSSTDSDGARGLAMLSQRVHLGTLNAKQ